MRNGVVGKSFWIEFAGFSFVRSFSVANYSGSPKSTLTYGWEFYPHATLGLSLFQLP